MKIAKLCTRNPEQSDQKGNPDHTWPSVPTPGVWIPTPPALAAPSMPWLGKMVPFTMNSPSQFRPEPPPALDSAEWALLSIVSIDGRLPVDQHGLKSRKLRWPIFRWLV